MQEIRLLFFGRLGALSQVVGQTFALQQDIETADSVRARIEADFPQIGDVLSQPQVKVAINKSIVSWSAHLRGGDELAFLPPVTGG